MEYTEKIKLAIEDHIKPKKVMNKKINPIKLKSMANSIAKSYGDKGAIVITMGDEGIRIGTQGLTFGEVREALCVAIHYCYCFEDDLLASEKP